MIRTRGCVIDSSSNPRKNTFFIDRMKKQFFDKKNFLTGVNDKKKTGDR